MAGDERATVALDAWLVEAHARLDAFAAEWRKNNATDPGMWSMPLPAGEWDEQYRCWDGA